MGIYIDNASARGALAVAAQHADEAPTPLPFLWDGSEWTTPTGERRDFPLIRCGMGEWVADLAKVLEHDYPYQEQDPGAAARLRNKASHLLISIEALDMDDFEAETTRADAEALMARADRLSRSSFDVWQSITPLKSVADDLLSAPNGRATHLLSLASQFEAFRAPMRDPAHWVRSLGAAPRSEHVRTARVWDAFCAAEPGLSLKLGEHAGKRVLFAAMDKRFGARKKLAGYEGWRGVALAE
ncbi:hypothetical protein EDD99_3231 [Streptomyces sp. 846.5]|nr:hypothetical protein [Streptomyces sp. 846.5]TDU04756.1 hypothetical protein EDD99_3231 [Streptomyces sp. 846.5]